MKKVIVSLLALTAVGVGFVIPHKAQAQSFNLNQQRISEEFEHERHHHEFKVLYRTHFGQVRFAGIYRDREEAEHEVHRLERHGYRAWLERI